MNFNDQKERKIEEWAKKKENNKTIQMQENTKTINDKTRQQEGTQNTTRLKKKPNYTVTLQEKTRLLKTSPPPPPSRQHKTVQTRQDQTRTTRKLGKPRTTPRRKNRKNRT